MNHENLPELFEITATILEDPEITKIASSVKKGMSIAQVNALVLRISAQVMRSSKANADKLVALYKGKTEQEVADMTDAEYGNALKEAVTVDVIGFFN